MDDIILYEAREGIAYITLNKPKVGNCMNHMLTDALYDALARAQADPAVGAVLLAGSGKAFCTGGDVPRMSKLEGAEVQCEEVHASGRALRMMTTMEKPVICAVQGFAAGAGLGLVLASDLVICEENARFMTAFTNVGLASDCGAAWLLAKTVGRHKAKELLWLSETITAQEMKDLGLVNRIVAAEDLMTEAEALARKVLARPAFACRLVKNLVNRSDDMNLEASIMYEEALQALLMNTPDFAEGTGAFLEKRRPEFGKK